jgi:hypothetical protein
VYEHRSQPPISTGKFVRRLLRHAGYGAVLIFASLAVGTIGFATLASETPIDALLNAAMLLGGMGPVGDLSRISVVGKLFAAGFALYAGLLFLIVAGILVTPVLHRVLHRFHWDSQQGTS